MLKTNRCLRNLYAFLIVFLLSIPSLSAGSLDTNWEVLPNHSLLHLGGSKVFDSRESIKQLPQNLNQDQLINFCLLVGEYYLLKNDKDAYFNIITLLDNSPYDYSLLEEMLFYFWRIDKSESNEADLKFEGYAKKEPNAYLSTLANAFFQFNKKKGLPKLDFNEIKNLNCSGTKPYFTLCRVMKLRVGLESLGYETMSYAKDYQYIDKSLAPFFEDNDLTYIAFLDLIIPDLAPKLAYIGFAGEAVHFQKMILQNEKLSGKFDVTSYERLAFYQMILGDLDGAEDTLYSSLKNLRTLSIIRNGILLKLGAIAYLRKDYEQSLIYFTGLNMQYWGRTLRHPILDDAISPNGARELIALVISRAKNPGLAVEALNKLNTSKVEEEDLFIRLRIAQIMFKARPTLTEKITDDLIYLAQSKGWKRLEYAATLLNGYSNIINKKHRKSVIQFTKSLGILGSADPSSTSEWMRQSGLLTARIQGKEKGNHGITYSKLIPAIKKDNISENDLTVRMYLDNRFGVEEFIKQGINYFISSRDYEPLLMALYYNQSMNTGINYQKSILQINNVHKRIKEYKGFRPSLDNIYYKGYQSRARQEFSTKLDSEVEEFDLGFLKKINDPFIAIFPMGDVMYAVGYQPDKSKWTFSIFSSSENKTSQYFLKVLNSFNFIDKNSVYQIYMNQSGLDLFNFLKKNGYTSNARLFYNFQVSPKRESRDLDVVTPECSYPGDKKIINLNYYPLDYYDGSKSFESSSRLQIWRFSETINKGEHGKLDNYSWKCDSKNYLSFQKLIRRLDNKAIPSSILMINPLLQDSSLSNLSNDYYAWSDFWMRKGTTAIYFLDKLDNDSATSEILQTFAKAYPNSTELIHIQDYLNTNSRESVILSREPK